MGICINEALLVLGCCFLFFFPTLLVSLWVVQVYWGFLFKFLLILSYSVVLMFTLATMLI